jgi:peptidoglycan/xylan/chitin deacetylase (PgdA/CDA1 family)
MLKEACINAMGKVLRRVPARKKLGMLADGFSLSLRPLPRLLSHAGFRSQILIYHRVLPAADPFGVGVATEAEFAAQMRVLREHFQVLPLPDLIDAQLRGRPIPGAVAITFDDGYRDNYAHAFPILEEYGFPATIFLATDFIGTGEMPWHDRVLAFFRSEDVSEFAYAPAGIAARKLSGAPSRRHLAFELLEWLKTFRPSERDRHIAAFTGSSTAAAGSGPRPAAERLMLDWDEVRKMRAAGIHFGAHTRSHPILSSLDPELREAEIAGSRAVIERELGEPVTLFAYPNGKPGDYGEPDKAALRRQGFACALTTTIGVNTSNGDMFEILRRPAWEASPDGFLCRMLFERMAA